MNASILKPIALAAILSTAACTAVPTSSAPPAAPQAEAAASQRELQAGQTRTALHVRFKDALKVRLTIDTAGELVAEPGADAPTPILGALRLHPIVGFYSQGRFFTEAQAASLEEHARTFEPGAAHPTQAEVPQRLSYNLKSVYAFTYGSSAQAEAVRDRLQALDLLADARLYPDEPLPVSVD